MLQYYMKLPSKVRRIIWIFTIYTGVAIASIGLMGLCTGSDDDTYGFDLGNNPAIVGSVEVGGDLYWVLEVDEIYISADSSATALGLTDFNEQRIYLRRRLQSASKANTFRHELCHIAIHDLPFIYGDNEELLCNAVAKAFVTTTYKQVAP